MIALDFNLIFNVAMGVFVYDTVAALVSWVVTTASFFWEGYQIRKEEKRS
jgi:hypothetical protein